MSLTTMTTDAPIKSTKSTWEDIEYNSGLPEWTAVKNTFIDCPADRSWSLEEFLQMTEQKCKSCPSSGVLMHPASKILQSQTILEVDTEESTTDESDGSEESETEGSSTDGPETPRLEEADQGTDDDIPWENITYGDLPEWTSVKNTFIDCPAERSWSLEEFIAQNEQKCKSCPSSGVMMHVGAFSSGIFDYEDEIGGTGVTTASIQMQLPPQIQAQAPTQAESYAEEENRVVLNIAPFLPQQEEDQAVPSIGSQAHRFGQCMPCGFVHKPDGCAKGANCPFCHLCSAGTIKERKHMKKMSLKMRKMEAFAQRQAQQMWMGV